ncbi:MAG: hypothetical protein J6A56_05620 [Clostridia bacterium]|nr:hypothetical protein [Clostridia bacterium]
MRINQAQNTKDITDGIIVPPGCDNPMLHDCGESVSTYTPASYSPVVASKLPSSLPPHAMHGKTGGLSIPKGHNDLSQKSMTEYLNQFRGAYLCLDLWLDVRTKIKKCGMLMEVGIDFLALKETSSNKLTVIDLKPVRYINIYCK